MKIKVNNTVFNELNNIKIIEVTGLEPVSSTITTKKSGMNGTTFKGSTLDERNIVINGVIVADVKNNRLNLYKIFKSNKELELTFDDTYTITCYVENIEMNNFQVLTSFQISLICPNPYFYKDEQVIEVTEDEIEFITETETDWEIIANFTSDATYFTFYLNNYWYTCNLEITNGDTLTIRTKDRKIYLDNSNVYYSKNWTIWKQIEEGTNKTHYATDGSCNVSLKYKDKYIGI